MSRLTDHEWDDYNEPGCQDCSAYAYDCCRVDNAISDCHRRLIYNRLAAYEDAEESGLLIRLPCKVGDVLYEPYRDGIDCGDIHHVNIDIESDIGSFEPSDIGKTVFLAREEAEAKLKEAE